VECVEHRAVAEQKSKRFGFVSLRRIDPEFLRLLQNDLLNIAIDASISTQNPASRGHAHVRGGCNFSQSYFAFFRRCFLHALETGPRELKK
jgi:hypothetical protein